MNSPIHKETEDYHIRETNVECLQLISSGIFSRLQYWSSLIPPNHEDFVDPSYRRIMRQRRQNPEEDYIEPSETQNLNPELPDNP